MAIGSEECTCMAFVSVIIPTKGRAPAIVECVRSVFDGSCQQFEMFIIDQSADDQTYDALAPFLSNTRCHYLRNQKAGVGAASSRNMGIAMSRGEIIAILDDDVTARSDWMANIVAEFAADPDLQFICGKLTAPAFDWRTHYVPTFDPENTSEPLTDWTMPTFAAGANFSMRRALFDRVGGYDEFCGPGSRLGASDDGDLSFRIMRSGAKWKASVNVEVIHTNGIRQLTDGASLLQRYQRGVGGNYGRFTRRGDLLAGVRFLTQQARDIVTVVIPNVVRGRRPTQFGWVRDRLIGFWRGLRLPPNEGFVSPKDLARMRSEYLATELSGAPPATELSGAPAGDAV
jgi:glycosyltransferase involved in cell wall biosynthesis